MAPFKKKLQKTSTDENNSQNKSKKNHFKCISYYCRKIASAISKWVFIGIIFHVVATYFCPDFPEKFPVIYGIFTGCAQLAEFLCKMLIGGLYNLVTCNLFGFLREFKTANSELLQRFVAWLAQLHF